MAKKKSTKTARPPGDVQTIEQLQKEYELLHERRIRAQSELENAEARLSELQDEAREKFGTHDVAELEEQLQKMEAENEKRRSEYQQQLESIQAELLKIETDEAGIANSRVSDAENESEANAE